MKFFLPGIIFGAVLSLFLLSPKAGIEIYPEWFGGIRNISQIEKSNNKNGSDVNFFIRNDNEIYILKGDGSIYVSSLIEDSLAAFSGNGNYYIKYRKVGRDIEFFNIRGERFWKLESMEYPYLSYNAKIIFLMNGDHSQIRIVDYNGNEIGEKKIVGRTCTALSFSEQSDYGGIGFLDGSYYFCNSRGKKILEGMFSQDYMVKGIAISSNGLYASVHHGDTEKDYLRVINISSGDNRRVELKNVHPAKTSIHVSDNGYTVINDMDSILYISSSGKIEFRIAIPPKRLGASSISFSNGIYSAGYTMLNGTAKMILFREDGVILLSKEFTSESFLETYFKSNFLFLRGSDNLYCYSVRQLSSE